MCVGGSLDVHGAHRCSAPHAVHVVDMPGRAGRVVEALLARPLFVHEHVALPRVLEHRFGHRHVDLGLEHLQPRHALLTRAARQARGRHAHRHGGVCRRRRVGGSRGLGGSVLQLLEAAREGGPGLGHRLHLLSVEHRRADARERWRRARRHELRLRLLEDTACGRTAVDRVLIRARRPGGRGRLGRRKVFLQARTAVHRVLIGARPPGLHGRPGAAVDRVRVCARLLGRHGLHNLAEAAV
eukprot:scaffold76291_cov63-Phaeocystis_antarctica.AAC.2